jgi:hypothetical protein
MAGPSFQEQLAADLVATVTGHDGGDLVVVDGTEWWAERVDGEPTALLLENPSRRVLVRIRLEVLDQPVPVGR